DRTGIGKQYRYIGSQARLNAASITFRLFSWFPNYSPSFWKKFKRKGLPTTRRIQRFSITLTPSYVIPGGTRRDSIAVLRRDVRFATPITRIRLRLGYPCETLCGGSDSVLGRQRTNKPSVDDLFQDRRRKHQ